MANSLNFVTSEARVAMLKLTDSFGSEPIAPMAIGKGGVNFFFDRLSPNGREIYRTWAQILHDGQLKQVSEVRSSNKREFYRPGDSMFAYFEERTREKELS